MYGKIKTFKEAILEFNRNAKVPWREENDVRKILVGELLLIRTKYEQAAEVYREFWCAFPDGNIAPGQKEKALQILTKAGLKHRAEGILKALKYLNEHGKDPGELSFEELKNIPYASDYIASAVLFLSGRINFLYPDVNIIRILERYFGIPGKDKTHPSQKQLKLMDIMVKRIKSEKEKRRFTLNLLDFGLFICRPKPGCGECSLSEDCCLFSNSKQNYNFKRRGGYARYKNGETA